MLPPASREGFGAVGRAGADAATAMRASSVLKIFQPADRIRGPILFHSKKEIFSSIGVELSSCVARHRGHQRTHNKVR